MTPEALKSIIIQLSEMAEKAEIQTPEAALIHVIAGHLHLQDERSLNDLLRHAMPQVRANLDKLAKADLDLIAANRRDG